MRRFLFGAIAGGAGLAFWILALAWADENSSAPTATETAVFAGGCFWCVEADYDKLDGVIATVSGFAGGTVPDPTYKQVSAGGTGHVEVVQVTYDPSIVSYRELVDYFWRHVDPLDAGGQFCDRGPSYRTEIFVAGEAQRQTALASKTEAEAALGEPIVTAIVDLVAFYPAEDYHQNYYKEHPIRYRYYRSRCGRDRRINQLWGDVDPA